MTDYPDTVPVQPQAAEAATEIGADDAHPPATRWGLLLILMPWAVGVIGYALFAWLKS